MTEENQQPPEEWVEPPEEWIGQEVSLWHDEGGGGPRGSGGSTQSFGILEVINDWGVVIVEDHPEVSEGVLAFYPWPSVVSIKVGEPDTRRTRRGRPRR
jgi:hypothetical protein